jgi:hypothetical protein
VRGERKDYQEIEENKENKENRDIWVFQEMPVKKENRVSQEELENLASQDLLENQEDRVILVFLVK